MADDEPDFTLMKKKKKKKKAPNDDEPEPTQSSEGPAVDDAADVAMSSSEPAGAVGTDAGLLADDGKDEFNFATKKKKKKRKLADMDGVTDDIEKLALKKTSDDDEEPSANPVDGEIELNGEESATEDYTYQQLLDRVFNIMRQKNPDMVAGEKRKFVLKPPQVVRIGAKKSSFVNFTEICKLLHRQPKHLLAFICAELGTSGSVDANNQLIIKGRYQQKQIESVLRRYIKEYVTCHTCRSPDTMLQKETRLFFLQCESCGSRCSVASIKSGFQAVTSKRAAQRAKQQ